MKRPIALSVCALSALMLNSCYSSAVPIPTYRPVQLQNQTAAETMAQTELSQRLRASLESQAPSGQLDHFVQPDSQDLAAIPQDPRNPLSPAKVRLGQLLYHESALGTRSSYPEGTGTYSCASCHHAKGGFQANLRQGIGDGGLGFGQRGERRQPHPSLQAAQIDVQPVRTPAAINTAWQPNLLWNGQFGARGVNVGTETRWDPALRQNSTLFVGIENNRLGFDGVETQAIAGQQAHRLGLEQIQQMPAYQQLFAETYPQVPASERITPINTGLAIAAFERTLLSNQAPFQRWLRGDQQALSAPELRGALVFFGKGQCSSCHSGPALNSMRFEALGLNDLVGPDVVGSNPAADQHLGRGGFTRRAEDMFKFKVPQLYNLADSPFYGHGGSIRSLEAFVDYMNAGQPENPRVPASQLAPQFKPLGLSPAERTDLVAFLKNGLYDPNLARYRPGQLPSGACVPNNDPLSRRDLGC